jgi:hypothetical protein
MDGSSAQEGTKVVAITGYRFPTIFNCLADGEPIDEKGLEAMPWTPYCLAHQQQLEKSQPRRTATL